jgi:Uma2 family endonuclease
MPSTALVSVEEYLSTSYHPDVEYVNGELVERNAGATDHGRLQALIAAYLINREPEWRITVYTQTRTQVLPARFRLPDICVVRGPETGDPVIRTPPFLCIEILSKDDRAEDIQEKIEEYLAFGVKYVWIINHRNGLAYVHTAAGMTRAGAGILKTANPDIVLPLAEIWPKWSGK